MRKPDLPAQLLTMQGLKDLQDAALLDMLVRYTDEYLKLHRERGNIEGQKACKAKIRQIMIEIELRKKGKPDIAAVINDNGGDGKGL